MLVISYRGKEVFRMTGDEALVGRGAQCHVVIPSPTVARVHFRIVRDGSNYFVEDLGTSGGTFVAGKRAKPKVMLEDGVELVFGIETVKVKITSP